MSLCVRHRETFLLRLLSHLSCFVAASWKLCCAIQALTEQNEFLARHRSVVLSPGSQTQSHISPHVYTSGTAGSHPQLQAACALPWASLTALSTRDKSMFLWQSTPGILSEPFPCPKHFQDTSLTLLAQILSKPAFL